MDRFEIGKRSWSQVVQGAIGLLTALLYLHPPEPWIKWFVVAASIFAVVNGIQSKGRQVARLKDGKLHLSLPLAAFSFRLQEVEQIRYTIGPSGDHRVELKLQGFRRWRFQPPAEYPEIANLGFKNYLQRHLPILEFSAEAPQG